MISSFSMQLPVGWEWVLIVVAIVVVFFGVKKIPELARSFGKASAEYEKARIDAKEQLRRLKIQGGVGRDKLEEVADSLGIDYTSKNNDELVAAIERELNKSKH